MRQAAPTSAFEAALEAIGDDALAVMIFWDLGIHGIRALACTSRTLCILVTRYSSQAVQLSATEAEAEWANVTFVARMMRNLEHLYVGDADHLVVAMRTRSPVDIAKLNVASALFLGAALADNLHMLILTDGRRLNARTLRTCRRLDLNSLLGVGMAPIAEADVAFLRGIIWRNPHLELNAALERLWKRAFVNSQERLGWMLNGEDLADAEREYMKWARGWFEKVTSKNGGDLARVAASPTSTAVIIPALLRVYARLRRGWKAIAAIFRRRRGEMGE